MPSEIPTTLTYFTTNEKGQRTAYVVSELADASQIPGVAEPFFLAFNAAVEFYPVMTPADLMKAGPDIGAAVEKYAA